MTTTIGSHSEWTAAALRPVARWVPVHDGNGRTRLEMSWSVPTIEVPAVAQNETGASTAA
jgi:hypothetical protein